MIKSIKNLSFLLLSFSFVVTSCTVSVTNRDTSESIPELSKIESTGFIFSELELKGLNLNDYCDETIVTLSHGSTNYDLEILECKQNSITAWIPEDIEPDKYDVTLRIRDLEINSIDEDEIELEIDIRPVILTMSATEITAGETLNISGLHFLNKTSILANNPKVWIMKSGYTNTVSEITVNQEGTAASIIIDDGIAADDYTIRLTTEEWSNEMDLVIK